MNISKVNGYMGITDFSETKLTDTKEKDTFNNLLSSALNKVNEMQLDSNNYKNLLAVGELDNLHELTIASEKANTSLQIVMSMRNKVVEAYKEIMRIQI